MKNLLLFCGIMLAGFAADAQCVASFTHASASLNNALLREAFTNTSSYGLPFGGQRKTALIYYGDGNTATVGSTGTSYHTYASPGIYTVSLVIESIDSASGTLICRDSVAAKDTVLYSSCGTTFTFSGTGKTKSFSAFTPAGSTGMSYSWNFGDGGTGTGATTSHTYASNGTYTVTLTASKGSPATCTYTNAQSVVVYTAPPALSCTGLKASFTTSVSSNVVSVTNTSSTVSSPYKMDAYWNFGDGSALVNAFSPTAHTYTSTGIYTVTLQLYWHDSLYTTYCYDTAYRTVAVTSLPTPTNIISGNIYYDTLPGTNYFKVYLIKLDTSTNILSAVDSQITASVNVPYYAFASKAAGSYRVKAAVYLGSTSGTGVVPTYHDSSAYWNTATVIAHTGGSSLNKNIYMRTGTLSAGPGFIGGNVSLGANKGASGGVSGVLILLRNATTKIVKTTLTDANGDYSFENIPLGAYSVYPEEINYTTIPVTPIVINDVLSSINTINFNQDDVQRSIKPRSALEVATCNCLPDAIRVYPVPAQNKVSISWSGLQEASLQLEIVSLEGKVVGRTPVMRGRDGNVDMDISHLAKGLYFLHGKGSLASSAAKLVVQ